MISQPVASIDQLVDKACGSFRIVAADEPLDLEQPFPGLLGPDDLHPSSRSLRQARRRSRNSTVVNVLPFSASASPAAIDSRNR